MRNNTLSFLFLEKKKNLLVRKSKYIAKVAYGVNHKSTTLSFVSPLELWEKCPIVVCVWIEYLRLILEEK